jgi:hypothetical protein
MRAARVWRSWNVEPIGSGAQHRAIEPGPQAHDARFERPEAVECRRLLHTDDESKHTILNPEVAADHFTLLVVDMSGSVSESGDVPAIVDAASAFCDRVGKYQTLRQT